MTSPAKCMIAIMVCLFTRSVFREGPFHAKWKGTRAAKSNLLILWPLLSPDG
jgi:hypothetical protein